MWQLTETAALMLPRAEKLEEELPRAEKLEEELPRVKK